MARPTKSVKNPKIAGKKKATTVGKKRLAPSTFLKSLPESVEHIEIVQQVASVLEELQKRVLDVKEEASKELKKLMKRYETNYRGLEKKVHTVTLEAKRQAQTSMIQLLQKWHEHKEKLPKPLAKELEKIIDQIGARMVAQVPKKRVVKSKKSLTPAKKTRVASQTRSAATPKKKGASEKPRTTSTKAKAVTNAAKTASDETKIEIKG